VDQTSYIQDARCLKVKIKKALSVHSEKNKIYERHEKLKMVAVQAKGFNTMLTNT
jgi:hypothetical protein